MLWDGFRMSTTDTTITYRRKNNISNKQRKVTLNSQQNSILSLTLKMIHCCNVYLELYCTSENR